MRSTLLNASDRNCGMPTGKTVSQLERCKAEPVEGFMPVRGCLHLLLTVCVAECHEHASHAEGERSRCKKARRDVAERSLLVTARFSTSGLELPLPDCSAPPCRCSSEPSPQPERRDTVSRVCQWRRSADPATTALRLHCLLRPGECGTPESLVGDYQITDYGIGHLLRRGD